MNIIVGWMIAGICIALFLSFIGASVVSAVVSVREPQTLDEARMDEPRAT
jgi:hypothetical protein